MQQASIIFKMKLIKISLLIIIIKNKKKHKRNKAISIDPLAWGKGKNPQNTYQELKNCKPISVLQA